MEVLEDNRKRFLAVNDGYGYGTGDGNGYGYGYGGGYGTGDGNGDGNGNGGGYGNGYGYGYGTGDGYGDGYGTGYGYGDGYGTGDGYGNGDGYGTGDGISEINEYKVYMIDGTPTILVNVHGNLAKGFTLHKNVFLVPCYIAKVGNFFAHGKTAHEAFKDATAKYEENKPLEERIADTVKKYPTLDTVVSHQDLYELHHILTGSCKFGRDEFAQAHNLDPKKGSMTMQEFIDLTHSAYGGENIVELEKAYKNRLQ